MKLYFSPGACSLSPHIVLNEAALKYESEQVDLKTKQTKSGADFRTINPKGQVPALQLDNGEILTEGPAIVQYLADLKPATKLAPPQGSFERVRLQEWLNYIGTELHKGIGPLFNPKIPDAWREVVIDLVKGRLTLLDKKLAGKSYVMGDGFTVADAYLFTILSWTTPTKIGLDAWPTLQAYQKRVGARPAVQASLAAEGLVKQAAA